MKPPARAWLAAAWLVAGHAPVLAQEAPPRGSVTLGTPVAAGRLGDLRGGTDLTVNDVRVHGTTSGNTAHNVQTGANTITEGALAHLSGIPVVIQNTGANVLIQNAVVLNVQLR
jgi:hypothetical protein